MQHSMQSAPVSATHEDEGSESFNMLKPENQTYNIETAIEKNHYYPKFSNEGTLSLRAYPNFSGGSTEYRVIPSILVCDLAIDSDGKI